MNGITAMKGKYTGYSSAVMAVSFFIGLPPALLLAAVKSVGAVLVIFGISFLICTAGVILACYMPCRWEAGDLGFVISRLGFKDVFKYADIQYIGYEYVNSRYGGMIKLTVRDDIGETVFREICRSADMTELMNHPENGKKPQLVLLCEYVKQMKEVRT